MSSILTDLSEKCEMQEMDILALRKQVRGLGEENEKLRRFAEGAYYCQSVVGCDTMCPLAKYNSDGTVDCLFSKMADELGLEPNEYGDEG